MYQKFNYQDLILRGKVAITKIGISKIFLVNTLSLFVTINTLFSKIFKTYKSLISFKNSFLNLFKTLNLSIISNIFTNYCVRILQLINNESIDTNFDELAQYVLCKMN